MGYKIKALREALGMTQEELAEKSGISRQTISSLENNQTRSTSTKTLEKIAAALNSTVGNLFFADAV